jgi:hypothetical protein
MALTSQGRIEIQEELKSRMTKIKYVYNTYNSAGAQIGADLESSSDDVVFLDPNANAGLVLSTLNKPTFPITISSFGAGVVRVSITGLRLYESTSTTDYMKVDFGTTYDFTSDGNFNVTQLVVSFT